MTTTTLAQETAFKDAVSLSESMRQADLGVANAALTGPALQTAHDVAHRAHHRRVSEAAALNNMTAPSHTDAAHLLERKLGTK